MDAKALGIIMKTLRIRKGLTQADMARGICSARYIRNIENGEYIPTIEKINQFAHKLGHELYSYIDFSETDNCIEIYELVNDMHNDYLNWRYEELLKKIERFHEEGYDCSTFIEQRLAWYEGICYGAFHNELAEARTILTDALRITREFDTINQLLDKFCTPQELAIIFSIVASYKNEDEFVASKILYTKLISNITKYSCYEDELLYPRSIYNYTRILDSTKEHDLALEILDDGINYCISKGVLKVLPELYFQKCDHFIELNRYSEAKECFEKFVFLYKIQNKASMVEKVEAKYTKMFEGKLNESK